MQLLTSQLCQIQTQQAVNNNNISISQKIAKSFQYLKSYSQWQTKKFNIASADLSHLK